MAVQVVMCSRPPRPHGDLVHRKGQAHRGHHVRVCLGACPSACRACLDAKSGEMRSSAEQVAVTFSLVVKQDACARTER